MGVFKKSFDITFMENIRKKKCKKHQIKCKKKLLKQKGKKKSKILRIVFKILFEIRTFKNEVYYISDT